MPLLSPYQERQVRSALERQAQGDRTSRLLGFDARCRPVLQGLVQGKEHQYALLRNGTPTKVTGEVENPAIYVDRRNKYGRPTYVLCYKTAPGVAAHDHFDHLNDALERLVMA